MSKIPCDECSNLIDPQADPDCLVEMGNLQRFSATKILCESCRDGWRRKERSAAVVAFAKRGRAA